MFNDIRINGTAKLNSIGLRSVHSMFNNISAMLM